MAGIFGKISCTLPLFCDLNDDYYPRIGYGQRQIKILENESVSLGFTCHNSDSISFAWRKRVMILILGYCYYADDSWTLESADDLADLYLTHGELSLKNLSGSYQICLLDFNRQKAFIQNDRLGSIPLHYATREDRITFGPDAKSVFTSDTIKAQIDSVSAITFLREGYPFTDKTLFQNVQRLKPGHRITCDIQNNKIENSPYWSLKFCPNPKLTLDSTTFQTHELILQSHERVIADCPSSFGVFLTGGVDSRGMAGALHAINKRPSMCLTWCGKTGIPHSDPAIASNIAQYYGFQHRTVQVNADELAEKAVEWLRISELTTDNLGFFSASPDVFTLHDVPNPPCFLVGDEFFGHGGTPGSLNEAMSYVLKSACTPSVHWLRGCLRGELANEMDECFLDSIEHMLAALNNHTPRNVVDWLTYYVHRPCWSYSAGNCKEPALTVRRPFMADEIIDYISTFPESLRNDKTVYYEMLRRYMPQTLRFPRTTADSLFDWPWRFRNHHPTRSFLLEALHHEALLDGPLSRYLDADAILSFVDEYFSQKNVGSPQRFFGHHAVNLRRWLGKNSYTSGATQRVSNLIKKPTKSTQLNPTHLIRRLALLSLFIQELESGSFQGRSEI
ncbi:MAG: asparagine synthase-related protein [Kiritimatiellae bacterium]|jgi:hypothetical protein|nr:asparagine synthase-related protein [Kiritimatiellia bacterium]